MQRFRSWLNKITSTYLGDIFSALVVTQEKLDVLRRGEDCKSASQRQHFKLSSALRLKERRTTCTFWNLTNIRGITSSPFSCLLVRTMSLAKDYQWSPESDPLRVVLSGWIT